MREGASHHRSTAKRTIPRSIRKNLIRYESPIETIDNFNDFASYHFNPPARSELAGGTQDE
jgi:hypothetical protein